MLKHIINDFAFLKAVTGSDEYNTGIYSEPVKIKCKVEFAQKVDPCPNACQQTHPARMFCYEDVKLNDIVTYQGIDYKIIQVNFYKDFDNNPMFYEVFMI